MQDTLLIATGKTPVDEAGVKQINQGLREWAADSGLKVIGGIQWCEGPGCANLAIRLEAPTEGFAKTFEDWANAVTMTFGIAKWSNTLDIPPEIDTCTLNWEM